MDTLTYAAAFLAVAIIVAAIVLIARRQPNNGASLPLDSQGQTDDSDRPGVRPER